MESNPFRIRNTYLGVDGQRDEKEMNNYYGYSQGSESYHKDASEMSDRKLSPSYINTAKDISSTKLNIVS